MFRPLSPRPWAALAFVLAPALAGCDGPCRVLAERICECELNARERASCVEEIDSNGNVRQPSEAEMAQCTRILDKDGEADECNCAALEREDFAACGLTKPVEL